MKFQRVAPTSGPGDSTLYPVAEPPLPVFRLGSEMSKT
uniref:Uncharacterized protein n=1 Tax=Setaria italica TaxID=4555 RepID=K4AN14_SETIT